MKLQEVALYENKSHRLLNEGWYELTEAQQQYQLRFEKELWPLLEQYVKIYEAALTPQQIDAIFSSAEQKAIASGSNKTMLGKLGSAAKLPVDLAKKINAKIDELGRMAQNAGPVKNADQKFEQLKKDILAKNSDSKIVQGVQKISDWAKENPGKASLAVGVLTTLAAFASGPAGGAAAGLIFRATKDLLQGEKLSTAVGKSVKTAAYGAIAGWALEGVGNWLEGIRAEAVPYEKVPGLTQINVDLEYSLRAPGFSLDQTLGSMIVPADRADEFMQLVNAARGGDTAAFKELWQFTKDFDVQQAMQDINLSNQALRELAIQNDEFLKNLTLANDAIAAIAQGTVSGKMDANDIQVNGKELKADNTSKPTESLALELEKYIAEHSIDEGPMDALKKGAAAVGGALKKGAAKVAAAGREIGNKITKSKLMKAWKAAGEPAEAGEVAKVMQQAGVSDDIIKAVGAEQKVNLPIQPKAVEPKTPAAQTTAAQTTTATDPAVPSSASSPASAQTTTSQKAPAGRNTKVLQPIADMIKQAGVADAVKAMIQQELNAPAASTQQAAQSSAQQPAQAKTAAPATNKASTDSFEKAKGDIRNIQSGTKPLPQQVAQGLQGDLAKLAKGDKESGVFAANRIMKFAKAGYDVSKLQPAWLANAKQGERFLTQSVHIAISKMLKEYKLSWKDIGLKIGLIESTKQFVTVSRI
jgi:uncharacterized protein YidB (DUF937 family)